MGQKVTYEVVNRPSKESAGVTKVMNTRTVDGVESTVQIGTLTKEYGGVMTATAIDQATGETVAVEGDFATKSQAGHAVQRVAYQAERVAKEQARAARIAEAEAARVKRAEERAARKAAKEAEAEASEGEQAAA